MRLPPGARQPGGVNNDVARPMAIFEMLDCIVNEVRLLDLSILLKLYSRRYPVKITFQGMAAQLSHIFLVFLIMFRLVILYFLMFTSENYT